MRPEPRAVVRSTLPKAEAVLSALVRTAVPGAVRSEVRSRSAGARAPAETPMRLVVHRAVREPVDGEADTVGARSAAVTSRREARGRRSRPGRARRAPGRARRVTLPRGDIVTRAIEAFGECPEASDRQRRGAQRAAGQTECAATEGSGGDRDCSGNRPQGDWSGKPGREAGRPESSQARPRRYSWSAPSACSTSSPSS